MKYRILKLSTFTYIPQIQDKYYWQGISNRNKYTWDTKEHQMEYCRHYTLFGAKSTIRKHIKETTKEQTIYEAIAHLEQKPSYVKPDNWKTDYEKHIPRWKSEREAALKWLKRYKEEHGF
jgi:hypothetical protein